METTECPTALQEILMENQMVTQAIILLHKGDISFKLLKAIFEE